MLFRTSALQARVSATTSFRSARWSTSCTLVSSSVPLHFYTQSCQPEQRRKQKEQEKPTNGGSSSNAASFPKDHRFAHSLERFDNKNSDLRIWLRKPSSHSISQQSTSGGNSAQSKQPASSTASKQTPAQLTLQRKMHCKNRIAVLYPQDSHVVTLDLSIEHPSTALAFPTTPTAATKSKETSSSTPVLKSMVREDQEIAAKTLDRIRMLFAPPRPKGQVSQRQSREELLAACPSVRVYCNAADVGRTTEEDAVELVAANTVDVKLPRASENNINGDAQVVPYRELNTELPNSIFWKYARVLVLGGKTTVRIFYNVPTITSIAAPGVPYVGLPLVCANMSLLFAKEENVCYEWCVLADGSTTGRSGKADESAASTAATTSTRVVGVEPTFTPTADLLGKHLLLRVSLDSATGLWTELRLPDVVRPLPPPVARWEATTAPVAPPAFRVVTYNILYDDFCTSKSSKAKIYPFATDDILDLENRKVRIVQELLAYHTDLVCLQECGRDVFLSYLLPVMKAVGYDGMYMNKNGSVKEGCGFLFRRSRYELVHADSIPLNYVTLAVRHADLAERVGACPELKEAMNAVTTIGALLVLRDKGNNKEIVLGNTHLFFHANACHIRLLQVYILLHWLYKTAVMAEPSMPTSKNTEDPQIASPVPAHVRPVVLCGDFNCTHPTGAYRLLTTGQVEAGHRSWDKGKLFWWGCSRLLGYDTERLGELLGHETVLPQATIARKDLKRKKQVPGESASPTSLPNCNDENGEAAAAAAAPAPAPVARGDDHIVTKIFRETLHVPPLQLQDAYQRTDPSLLWTNFTLTFREVIDYVFFSSGSIEVLRTVPIPPESELAENFALPNKKYPSDHVALIADLSFKE